MTKRARVNGFTLLELIVFITVAGIFIPMAYVAFMAATQDSLGPERVLNARFLAETKLEDIMKDPYLLMQGEQGSYVAVPGSVGPYADYQWRWTIQPVAYQGRATHGNPIVAAPEAWLANTVYRVGDYITPATSLAATHFYRCVPKERWRASTSYPVNSYVSPTVPNNQSYRATHRLSFPSWQPNRAYNLGDYVVPTTPNGHSYRCTVAGTSGAVEPNPWPLAGLVADGTVTWAENTNTLTTGVTEPVWPSQSDSATSVDDGSINWVKEQMRSSSTEPTWPATGNVDDGSLRWQESTVYKLITVHVREPKGYEYTATTIVTARPGVYP